MCIDEVKDDSEPAERDDYEAWDESDEAAVAKALVAACTRCGHYSWCVSSCVHMTFVAGALVVIPCCAHLEVHSVWCVCSSDMPSVMHHMVEDEGAGAAGAEADGAVEGDGAEAEGAERAAEPTAAAADAGHAAEFDAAAEADAALADGCATPFEAVIARMVAAEEGVLVCGVCSSFVVLILARLWST